MSECGLKAGSERMNAIELTNLTRVYDRPVVDHLNLTIGEGELFGLLGVNGAGKTTTIRMLSCLTAPTEGDARILGHSVAKESGLIKPLINVSPQETAVAPLLTVRENLELIAGIYGSGRKQAAEKASRLIEQFSLQEVEHKRAKILSGGWQRRLSIAMALVSEPRVLFLDEPTLGLDVLARRELWAHIRALKGKITLILTTHYLEEAEALCDRIGVMAHGRLVALGTAAELKAQAVADSFEDAFVRLTGEGDVK